MLGLRYQNFSLEVKMNTTIPAELLTLKTRFDDWRANRKYVREPIPDELRLAVLEMIRRNPPSLIRSVLKVDPSRLKKKSPTKGNAPKGPASKEKPRPTINPTHPEVAFFKLPTVGAALADSSSAQTSPAPCRLQLERPDGSRLTLTLPTSDSLTINRLVADFLRGSER
jgi:hypothetical protein